MVDSSLPYGTKRPGGGGAKGVARRLVGIHVDNHDRFVRMLLADRLFLMLVRLKEPSQNESSNKPLLWHTGII